MPQCVLAYNPAAGRYPSRKLTERAAAVLHEYGWETKIEPTNSGKHITELALHASTESKDAFFVVGGDGSINYAIAGLVGTNTALGVLPAGTSNVFAQEQGLPSLGWMRWKALEDSARRLASGKVRLIDIGICNERPFLLWTGVGLDGFVVNRIEPRRRWKKNFAIIYYAASVVWNAYFWHGMNLRVETDAERINGQFLLSIVSNVHLYAGGLVKLSPDALLDDGVMDLWLFEGDNLGDTFRHALSIWTGKHVQSQNVHHFPFRSMQMVSDERFYIEMDGEPVVSEGPVTVKVRPSALRILVPRETPYQLFASDTSDHKGEQS